MKTLKFIKINPKSVYESKVIVQGNSNPMSPSISITRKIENPLSRYSKYYPNQSSDTSFSIFNSFRSNRDKTIDKSLYSTMLQIPKKTLVLDLDETLIHSSQEKVPKAIPNYTLFISFDSIQPKQNIYVYVRPYLNEFLEKMSRKYELMIFTASQPSYANPIIDLIDPNRLIGSRFFRSHCRLSNSSLVKDLTIANRNLNSVIIVDNSPSTYSLQINNGIPIPSWTGDNRDSELFKLINLLEYLADVNDVRDYLKVFIEKDEINYSKYLLHMEKKITIPEEPIENIGECNNKSNINHDNRNISSSYINKEQFNNTNRSIFSNYSYLPFNINAKPSLLKFKKKLLSCASMPSNNQSIIPKCIDRSSSSSSIVKLPLMKYKSKTTTNIHNWNENYCFIQESQENDLPVLMRSISKIPSKKDLFSYKVRKYTDQKLVQHQASNQIENSISNNL